MIDAIAAEPHFIDHLAPVWRLLPNRGKFFVLPELVERAKARGIEATPQAMPSVYMTKKVNSGGPVALVASYGDLKKGRRLGYGSFIFLEHGIAQSYGGDPRRPQRSGSYSGGPDRGDVSLFLVPNEHAAGMWRKSYPKARVEVIGCPKLDDTPAYTPTHPPLVALSFHWDCRVAPEAAGAWSYYRKHIPALRERFALLGHGHPRMLPTLDRYYSAWGVEVVRDLAEVLERAAVYVCDNSSSMYEFAATGRPVVVLNQPLYRRNVNHGLRFWDAADVGIQVNHPAELGDAIDLALADAPPLPANRERALDVVYAYREGASQRAVDAILDAQQIAA